MPFFLFIYFFYYTHIKMWKRSWWESAGSMWRCSFVTTADILLPHLLPDSIETIWLLGTGFCLASVCQQSCLLPPPLYSLNPLHFHWASLYSRVSMATLADTQQVNVSRGTGFSLLPLAAQSALGGSDWLAQPSRLIVFTEMRSRVDWLPTAEWWERKEAT